MQKSKKMIFISILNLFKIKSTNLTPVLLQIIFKIINFRKNEIDILMGNLKTKVNRQKFLFYPV